MIAGLVGLRLAGLPPVDLHGPLHFLGLMDPLCGGTRAALWLSRGDLSRAWHYNPLLPLLGIALVAVAARWLLGTFGCRWYNVYGRNRRLAVVLGAIFTIALWANQQSHATLLMGRRAG